MMIISCTCTLHIMTYQLINVKMNSLMLMWMTCCEVVNAYRFHIWAISFFVYPICPWGAEEFLLEAPEHVLTAFLATFATQEYNDQQGRGQGGDDPLRDADDMDDDEDELGGNDDQEAYRIQVSQMVWRVPLRYWKIRCSGMQCMCHITPKGPCDIFSTYFRNIRHGIHLARSRHPHLPIQSLWWSLWSDEFGKLMRSSGLCVIHMTLGVPTSSGKCRECGFGAITVTLSTQTSWNPLRCPRHCGTMLVFVVGWSSFLTGWPGVFNGTAHAVALLVLLSSTVCQKRCNDCVMEWHPHSTDLNNSLTDFHYMHEVRLYLCFQSHTQHKAFVDELVARVGQG